MPLDPIALLMDRIEGAGSRRGGAWPPECHRHVARAIQRGRAFLDTNRDELQAAHGVTSDEYKVDPLGEAIADAWADHLFGEALVITPAAEQDDAALTALLEGNDGLIDDLHAAERDVVGEGEKWWRAYIDRDVADYPLLEWHSRDVVIPLFIGKRLMAAALVSELERQDGDTKATRWRHFEVHAAGVVAHFLYRGTATRLGEPAELSAHTDLVELAEALEVEEGDLVGEWKHGIPAMLMGRVINRRGRNFDLGVSDFHRIEDYLFDLNEAATIGTKNMRLTARRRVVVPEESLTPRATGLEDRGDGTFDRVALSADFDAGEDVLTVSKLDAELGKSDTPPFKVLEYSFDAQALITWTTDRVETAVTRVGLTAQSLGITGTEGYAISGTALRLRLIPQTRAGRGKWRPWGDQLPQAISVLAQLDALPDADGGFGRAWTDPAALPGVARNDDLPTDEVEEATVESTLVSAGVRSRETSIRRQNPEWSDDEVGKELDRIKADRPAASALFGAP